MHKKSNHKHEIKLKIIFQAQQKKKYQNKFNSTIRQLKK